jgi:single-strand DNA-binding protein
MDINQVTIAGRLGADPELKYIPSGQAVCTMRIATSEFFEKDGEKQERTEWHSIVAWGKLAEAAAKNLSKGQQVVAQGKLQTRSWDSKDTRGDGTAIKMYRTEIVVFNMVFGAKGRGNGDDGASHGGGDTPPPAQPATQPQQARPQTSAQPRPAPAEAYGASGGEDDIPF